MVDLKFFMEYRKANLSEISSLIDIKFIGENIEIKGLNMLNRKSKYDSILSYATNYDFMMRSFENKSIKALFIKEEDYCKIQTNKINCTFFIHNNPEEKFHELHELLVSKTDFYLKKIGEPKIGQNSVIHQSAVVENDTEIGNNVVIGPNVYISRGTKIGNSVKIGANTVIGAEGFQVLYKKNKTPFLVTHVGGVYIADGVSIGSNVTICKSLFEGDTFINVNTKIDNNINISHNCVIGKNCVIVSGTNLTGSVTLNDNVWISPNSLILNKVILKDHSFVGSMSLVSRDVEVEERVFGIPARKIIIQNSKNNGK
jgi:UDP-3-O-[3-hydroxymyristoyl] glucosamine N-acyltransferase